MKSVRCNGCHGWFPAKQERCDKCGLLRPGYNIALVSQRWANALNERAAQAARE
jgi:rRNA maturation endonuclease Nob1